MAADSGSLQREVRLFVYAQLIETSAAPEAAETAKALGCSVEQAEQAYRALADARMLVLRPGSITIWMAMPFSNIQTPFTVISGGRAYYANSAWGAFGIATVLNADARIFTTCADCGGAIERKISGGALSDMRGVVHFPVPARHWWDDVRVTSSRILMFGSEDHVDRWCAREQVARGELLNLDQTWALAKVWYHDRLDPAWRRPTAEEATAMHASIGLTGDFWSLI